MRIYFFLIFIILFSCKPLKQEYFEIDNNPKGFLISRPIIKIDSLNYKNWQNFDVETDKIPGTSFYRGVENLIHQGSLKETITIANIDTSQDTENKFLKPFIWKNSKEVINDIDDDGNGYIDDINGWNFLGTVDDRSVLYNQFESTRIISYYGDPTSNSIHKEIVVKSHKYYDSILKLSKTVIEQTPFLLSTIRENYKKIGLSLNDTNITKKKVDSLALIHKVKKEDINFVYQTISLGLSYPDLKTDSLNYARHLEYYLNKEYNDRENIKNYSKEKTHEKHYGNRYVNTDIETLYHGTLTAGLIALPIYHQDKLKDKIKIMSLVVSNYGDEHDEDIANAIRYAVDNGAKVINISSGKSLSKNPKTVMDALKYAAKKDVLCVTSAGNEGVDMDNPKITNFPNDTSENKEEIINNFIKVGGSGYNSNEHLKTKNSNYGKREVDLFAPGIDLLTLSTQKNSQFEVTSGTSFAAPQVSLIAALLFSKYPSLTASEVKQILMDSAVRYDILVDLPTQENPERQVPFSSLSKSGGIVNAYNALLLAEKVVKEKK